MIRPWVRWLLSDSTPVLTRWDLLRHDCYAAAWLLLWATGKLSAVAAVVGFLVAEGAIAVLNDSATKARLLRWTNQLRRQLGKLRCRVTKAHDDGIGVLEKGGPTTRCGRCDAFLAKGWAPPPSRKDAAA